MAGEVISPGGINWQDELVTSNPVGDISWFSKKIL
jgi:hypothetical protein